MLMDAYIYMTVFFFSNKIQLDFRICREILTFAILLSVSLRWHLIHDCRIMTLIMQQFLTLLFILLQHLTDRSVSIPMYKDKGTNTLKHLTNLHKTFFNQEKMDCMLTPNWSNWRRHKDRYTDRNRPSKKSGLHNPA